MVIDASVLANALADEAEAGERARDALRHADALFAPDLIDVETAAVFRKHWRMGTLSSGRYRDSLRSLRDLSLERVPSLHLLERGYELRENVSSYDAVYVALAEVLECEFLTGDRRLAAAPGIRCAIRVLD